MKGDYSRIPFNERKRMQHYRKVYHQQGKVLLDSDLNENTDLLHHQMKTLAKDGLCGSPNIGFRIGKGVPLLPVDDHRYIGKGWSITSANTSTTATIATATIDYFKKFEGKGCLKIQKAYLFSWDNIPGNDNERLIGFLKQRFKNFDWLNNAQIQKVDDNTKKIYYNDNSLVLVLDINQTMVEVKINTDTIDEFLARLENGKLNIYQKAIAAIFTLQNTSLDLSRYRYIRLAFIKEVPNDKIINLHLNDDSIGDDIQPEADLPIREKSESPNIFSVLKYPLSNAKINLKTITEIGLSGLDGSTTYYIGALECSPPLFTLDLMTHLKEWTFVPPENAGVLIKDLNGKIVMEASKIEKMYKKHFSTIDFSKLETIEFAIESNSTSDIQFYVTDKNGNLAYWDITILTNKLKYPKMITPDGYDQGVHTDFTIINEYGFRNLNPDPNIKYHFGSILYEMSLKNNFVISGADPLSEETGRLYVDGELYEKEEAETYLNQKDCPSAPSMELEYLFNWNKINEKIGKLIEFLAKKFKLNLSEIEWIKTATIQKIDNDKTIKISKEEKFLTLTLNDDQTVSLIIDKKTDSLIAKTEDGTLNIYNKYEPANGRTDFVYVDVWQKHVTSADDPELREVAVGVDTCNRMKAVAQVKVLKGEIFLPDRLKPTGDGGLSTVVESMEPEQPCKIISGVEYTGAENRLYRVEIHEGGAIGTSTYKWSRNNGSTVSHIMENVGAGAKSIKVRDVNLFKIGDLIEITDDRVELADRYSSEKFNPWGELRKITDIYGDRNELTWAKTSAAPYDPRNAGLPHDYIAEGAETTHPRVIKWDGEGKTSNEVILVDGIKIQFSGGGMLPGDYWTFTARERTRAVERLDNEPPQGVVHHYYPLAVITWDRNGEIISIEDKRTRFEPLCGLTAADLAFDNANTQKQFKNAKNVQEALEQFDFPNAGGVMFENTCKSLYGEANTVQAALERLCGEIIVGGGFFYGYVMNPGFNNYVVVRVPNNNVKGRLVIIRGNAGYSDNMNPLNWMLKLEDSIFERWVMSHTSTEDIFEKILIFPSIRIDVTINTQPSSNNAGVLFKIIATGDVNKLYIFYAFQVIWQQ